MFIPSLRLNDKGIPILSKDDIEEIAFRMINDYNPESMAKPQPFDIESFAEFYLKTEIEYKYLSSDGRFLGMYLYNNSEKVIIYDEKGQKAEYLPSKARTIFIDTSLLEEENDHRLRYTFAHECGHAILHTGVFNSGNTRNYNYRMASEPIIQCRKTKVEGFKDYTKWSDTDRIEWQANYLASAILLPKQTVLLLANEYPNANLDPIPLIYDMVKTFNVSVAASLYRLKSLGIAKNSSYSYVVDGVKEFENLINM